ncbi:MAG TPA: hypothetical protein VI894_01485 [Candidatus Nanoarchaeia archaeon]|nr:hypothetical protein [Candidatus Nanoarchaeia archaeon]
MPEKNIEDLVDDENLPDNPGRRRFLKFAGNAVAGSLALEY